MIIQAMITGIRAGELRETAARPVEPAAVNHRAADAGAMAADKFGQRIADDIRPMLKRLEQYRRSDRVVDDQWNLVLMGDGSDGLEVVDIVLRVTDGFQVNRLGLVIDGRGKILRFGTVDKLDGNAHPLEGVIEQVIGPAVKAAGGDNVVPGLSQVKHRQ